MAIKISKVIKDLNVGRQTIEEFLHKKGIEIDASINARIQDDVYEMLVKEFKPDMDLKSKSDKMATERQKEKAKQNAAKAESHEIKTEVTVQKPKILGKIDLEAAGKPKAASKPAAKAETPASESEKTASAPDQPVVENKEPETAAPVMEDIKKEEAAPAAEAPAVENQPQDADLPADQPVPAEEEQAGGGIRLASAVLHDAGDKMGI